MYITLVNGLAVKSSIIRIWL